MRRHVGPHFGRRMRPRSPARSGAVTVPEALRHAELRRFDLRRQRLPVAGGTLSLVTPRSMDDLLEAHPDPSAERMPYWAEIWPAAVGVARLLMRGPPLHGRRVLDLGCGLGLAGIAAAKRGAAAVVFADRERAALQFARFNAEHNGVAAESVDTLLLDWFERTAPGQFDLLLLADVAYEARNHEPLLRHVRECLVPGGKALLGDPYREQVDPFVTRAQQEFATEVVAIDTSFQDRRVPLRCLWITR